MTHRCLEAAKELNNSGIDAAVIHVPCLKPLNGELLLQSAAETGLVVTAENHNVLGGLGSAVTEILSEKAPAIVRRVGVKDVYVETGDDNDIYEKYGLTVKDIINAAVAGLKEKRNG
jgi:transketolase